jgi:hypothetical protein
MVFLLPISSIFAQTQEKGFISKETNDIAQSIGITNGTRWALLIGIANYLPSEMFDVQPLKSPVTDIDSLQASKISIDEFILRAKIFYEKIKGTPIKQSQIVEKKPMIEEKKSSPTKVIDDNLQITESRNLGVGLYISYLKWGENDGDYSPPLEFGLKSNIRFTNYLSAEMSAGYYHVFDKWWDEVLLKNIESNICKFPIRATLIGHIPNKITSPFIGFGPTFIYGREKSDFYHDDNSYAHSENDQYMKYGGHILLGIDIPVMSYLTFSGSFGYEFVNDYSAPIQFSLSIIYKLR